MGRALRRLQQVETGQTTKVPPCGKSCRTLQPDNHSANVGLLGPNRAVMPGLIQAARATQTAEPSDPHHASMPDPNRWGGRRPSGARFADRAAAIEDALPEVTGSSAGEYHVSQSQAFGSDWMADDPAAARADLDPRAVEIDGTQT